MFSFILSDCSIDVPLTQTLLSERDSLRAQLAQSSAELSALSTAHAACADVSTSLTVTQDETKALQVRCGCLLHCGQSVMHTVDDGVGSLGQVYEGMHSDKEAFGGAASLHGLL